MIVIINYYCRHYLQVNASVNVACTYAIVILYVSCKFCGNNNIIINVPVVYPSPTC